MIRRYLTDKGMRWLLLSAYSVYAINIFVLVANAGLSLGEMVVFRKSLI